MWHWLYECQNFKNIFFFYVLQVVTNRSCTLNIYHEQQHQATKKKKKKNKPANFQEITAIYSNIYSSQMQKQDLFNHTPVNIFLWIFKCLRTLFKLMESLYYFSFVWTLLENKTLELLQCVCKSHHNLFENQKSEFFNRHL